MFPKTNYTIFCRVNFIPYSLKFAEYFINLTIGKIISKTKQKINYTQDCSGGVTTVLFYCYNPPATTLHIVFFTCFMGNKQTNHGFRGGGDEVRCTTNFFLQPCLLFIAYGAFALLTLRAVLPVPCVSAANSYVIFAAPLPPFVIYFYTLALRHGVLRYSYAHILAVNKISSYTYVLTAYLEIKCF